MIPAKADVRIQSNIEGEKIAMGMDQKSLAFLQGILTDLYSDPEEAIIREYSTNARDSHVEAGVKKPIEIYTPGPLNRSFRVKDFGVGLSLEDIKKVYSLYGASTKRHTNTQNGMLGLGSKSALTYTNQFTVKAVKDGETVSVLVTRDQNGVGTMEILHQAPTNEENGVEINIPIKDNYQQFTEKVKNFFKYWINFPVLIDGQKPEELKAAWITDDIAVVDDHSYGVTFLLHMSGVTYRVDSTKYRRPQSAGYRTTAILFAEPGSVDFTPSREDLYYSERTINVINDFVDKFDEAFKEAMQRDIENQPTASDALKAYKEWSTRLVNGAMQIKWRGKTSPNRIDVDEWYKISQYSNNFYSSGTTTQLLRLNDDVILVGDKPRGTLTNSQRHKCRLYLDLILGKGRGEFIFIDVRKYSPWLDDFNLVKWSDIMAVKQPKPNNPPKPRTPPKHYVFTDDYLSSSRIEVTDVKALDSSVPMAYSGLQEIPERSYRYYANLAKNMGVALYAVPKNQTKAFLNLYPEAKHFKKMFVEKIQEFYDSFTEEEHEQAKMLRSAGTIPGLLVAFEAENIDDPVLKEAINLAKKTGGQKNLVGKLDTMQTLYNYGTSNFEEIRNESKKYRELLESRKEYSSYFRENYPLLDNNPWRIESHKVDHATVYMNAIYNREKND